MNITGLSGATAGAASPTASQLGPDQFLRLLMAELQTQDPLDPLDTQAMITQLSTMQMVAENRISRQNAEFAQAVSLLGRQATWRNPLTGALSSGTVTAVARDGSETVLMAGTTPLRLADLMAVA